jgi:hypothetical protein
MSAGCRPTPRSLQRPLYNLHHTKAECGSEGVSWIDFIGFSAAFTVLASFCMTTIVALSVRLGMISFDFKFLRVAA